MAAIGFSFPTIDAQSSHFFQISGGKYLLSLLSIFTDFLLTDFTTFSFGNFFFIFIIKPMSRKKRKPKWETEIDLQETKTEQSQRLWRTETNVQNSMKR